MGRFRPFPIVGGAYTDDALPWAHQDTVNYLPVRAEREGTRSPAKLAMVPGARVVSDVGTGPHRGGRDVEGQSFVVSGTSLYKIAADGVATSCGTIPGTGRVRMTHNQITGGNQVFIATGSSGYVYDTVAETLSQVTDDAFPGAKSCDFLGQYILGVEPFGRYWFHSALVDATDYNSLDVFQAETSPDRIVGLIASHNEVLIFGERTIEPWANVPTENAAFQLQVGSVIETGCASGDTLCRLDNSVYFLTDKGQVAKLEGYTPRVISTYAMEGAIHDCDLSRAFAFTWEDKGHTVYYLTFPDGQTWGYDVRQNEWHRRESFGIDRWRLNTLFKSNGEWYGGDYKTGFLYRLDWSYPFEGCDPISRRRSMGYVHDNSERVTVNAFQVLMDSGAAESDPEDAITISGALPDAYVDDTASYQYTITPAYPGQSYTLEVSGLPTGLSMNGTGLVTGTYNTAGSFTVTLTAVNDCGTETVFTDEVVVSDYQPLAMCVTNGFWLKADADANTLSKDSNSDHYYLWADSCNTYEFTTTNYDGDGTTDNGPNTGSINGIRAAHFNTADIDSAGLQARLGDDDNTIKNIASGRVCMFIAAIWRNDSNGTTPADRRVVYWSGESGNGNNSRIALQAFSSGNTNGVTAKARQDVLDSYGISSDDASHAGEVVIGVMTANWLTGAVDLYVNGTLADTSTMPNFAGTSDAAEPLKFFIGSQDGGGDAVLADIHLGELIAQGLAGPISTADRQTIEGYLAWKWRGDSSHTDTVALLPADHPYKTTPPV